MILAGEIDPIEDFMEGSFLLIGFWLVMQFGIKLLHCLLEVLLYRILFLEDVFLVEMRLACSVIEEVDIDHWDDAKAHHLQLLVFYLVVFLVTVLVDEPECVIRDEHEAFANLLRVFNLRCQCPLRDIQVDRLIEGVSNHELIFGLREVNVEFEVRGEEVVEVAVVGQVRAELLQSLHDVPGHLPRRLVYYLSPV